MRPEPSSQWSSRRRRGQRQASTDATSSFLRVLLRSESGRVRAAAGLGVAVGLAFLSKYAAVYFVLGLALHAAADADARRRWRCRHGLGGKSDETGGRWAPLDMLYTTSSVS